MKRNERFAQGECLKPTEKDMGLMFNMPTNHHSGSCVGGLSLFLVANSDSWISIMLMVILVVLLVGHDHDRVLLHHILCRHDHEWISSQWISSLD